MNRIAFAVDPYLRSSTAPRFFDTRVHAAAARSLAFSCGTGPLRAYIERGGIFSFKGEKIAGTEAFALELLSAGAHQIMIPRGKPAQMIGLSASTLLSGQNQGMPKGYRQTLDLIDTIELKSHLIGSDLYAKILADISWKGNEIANKIAAAGLGLAGAGFLIYTFPMNSFLLRLAGSAYIAGGALSWAAAGSDTAKCMDILQAAMRPTFAEMEPYKALEAISIIGRIRDTSVKEIYIGSLPDASKHILEQ